MRRSLAYRWYIAALAVSDALLLVLAFVGAAALRGTVDLLPVQPSFDLEHYGVVAAVIIPVFLGILWSRGAYDRRNLLGGPEEYVQVIGACTYGTLLAVAASYIYGSLPLVSRGWLLCFWLLAIGLVGTGRFTLRRVAYALRRRGCFIRRVLIVGASDQGLAIAQQLDSPLRQGVEVVGFLDDYAATGTRIAAWQSKQRGRAAAEFPVLGHPREVQQGAAETQADLLIVVSAALSWESQQLVVHLANARGHAPEVRLAPTHYDLDAAQVQPASLGFVPLVRVHPARLVGVDALLRGACDVALAAAMLLAVAPALLAVLAVAWVRGTRPLVASRRVLGQGGAPVTLYLLNRHVTGHLVLRGAPALLAVLQGHLALVGPRPVPVEQAAEHEALFSLLLSVKPGLTGPWRLAQPELSPEECRLADIWWVRNWSIWQHLFVLTQTVHRIWRHAPTDRPVQRWEVDVEPYLKEVAA